MADYLLTIGAVRDKSTPIFKLALDDSLKNFDSQIKSSPGNLDACIEFICKLINRDFGTDYESIPPHGRWQHLEAGGKPRVKELIELWQNDGTDGIEITRRLLDLFVVSVLLDAGAGNVWKYKEPGTDDFYNRSEGLAVVSIYIFKDGGFANDGAKNKYQVNGRKLKNITDSMFKDWLQVKPGNELAGCEGRLKLLQDVSKALTDNPEIFGGESSEDSNDYRPGNIIDYLLKKSGPSKELDMNDLWNCLMTGFNSIWSSRLTLEGKSLGDAWYCESAKSIALTRKTELEESDKIVPFHKLTQWLTYSLLIPLKEYGGFTIINEELLTGLPEYRNGGLLLDFGLLSIKPEILKKGIELTKSISGKDDDLSIPSYKPDDDLIVEWRCCTVGFLDYLLPLVNEKLGIKGTSKELKLPQLIEAGSWKAGREIAAIKRPKTSGPPIALDSDGTVF